MKKRKKNEIKKNARKKNEKTKEGKNNVLLTNQHKIDTDHQ